jgi:DNA-directed RNA polymerase subunit RPC12/RpoP
VSTCGCGKPCDGSFICPSCSKAMEIALGNISAYWADLDTVKGRQTRYGGSGGGRGGEKPLPVDLRFLGAYEDGSRLQEQALVTIGVWGRIVMEERLELAGPTHDSCLHVSCSTYRRSRYPRGDVIAYCRYMLGHADWIRTQHWAPDILDEMDNLEAQLRRFVDRPRESWYAGPCAECGKALYAKVGEVEVTCKDCNHTCQVKDRRTVLLREAADKLVPAALIARAVSWLGEDPLTSAKVRLWGHRKQLQVREYVIPAGQVGPTCDLRPLYRLGDACDLLALGDGRKRRAG